MEEDDAQQFCLRWHHHQSSVVGALGGALRSGALADVTLSAGGSCVRAHRLVLGSCSQYFASLFKEVPTESGALVVVLGCSSTELRLLLTFMYTGEVTCSRRRLPRLLRLARSLRVDGLTDADGSLPNASSMDLDYDKDSDTQDTPSLSQATPRSPSPDFKPPEEEPPGRSGSIGDVDGGASSHDALPEYSLPELSKGFGIVEAGVPGAAGAEPAADLMRPLDRLSKLDQIVQQLYSTHKVTPGPAAPVSPTSIHSPTFGDLRARRWRPQGAGGGGGGGGAVCTVCHKRLSNQYNLRVHLETHAGARHACPACAHVSRSRDALRKHVAYRHPAAAAPPSR